jgi:gliding motility-associated-like protein
MREQNIEKLFKETFSDFEADVNPNAWANISQQLQPTVSSPSADASTSKGTWGFWRYAGLFVAGSAVVVAGLIYFSKSDSDTQVVKSDNSAAPVSENPSVNSSASEHIVLNELNPALVKEENPAKHITEPKQTEQKNDELTNTPVIVNTPQGEQKKEVPAEPKKETIESPSKVDITFSKSTQQQSEEPAVESEPLVSEEDFVMMTEQHDNSIPREQEPHSDFTFYIPTVFTPNGDFQNDTFKPMGVNFKDYELVIYDVNSNEIFRSNDIENIWDGRLKDGTLAPSGFYAVRISVKDLNNVERPYQGQLLLKR